MDGRLARGFELIDMGEGGEDSTFYDSDRISEGLNEITTGYAVDTPGAKKIARSMAARARNVDNLSASDLPGGLPCIALRARAGGHLNPDSFLAQAVPDNDRVRGGYDSAKKSS